MIVNRKVGTVIESKRILNVKVKTQPGRKIWGLERFISPGKTAPEVAIPQLWEQFTEKRNEITNSINNEYTYGLFTYAPPFGPGQDFHYLAGIEISDNGDASVPDGVTEREIPPSRYAVVTFKGSFQDIGEAFRYYYGTYVPQSDYECVHNYEYELFDHRYLGMENENTVIELHFPVVHK